ncbi:molybdenum cofactor guanylyltransferase [Polynucleobacter paludilacus]|uniref:molybdenum cofactor guanylyltransferase MobA n=1 Tax=Polynucleobacter paludilacus TaxID=1855895 RepID=UPI001BFD20BE|nr:molybdenum cofactor guanylyltransferase MobA [Polynucleobacter paludilacus]QWD86584.1 molybdenum cofactor guanylyltransferase [Polynucleobacter paludilacus]
MISRTEITGLILAGGRAQRMGGVDKGLIPFHHRPLIESVIHRLRPQVGSILINANRNLEQYSTYGFPVLSDDDLSFSGPLAGFAAGLKACPTEYLVTAPCDSPLLPTNLVELLAAKMTEGSFDLVYASSKDLAGKAWAQPVFCLMRIAVLKSLQEFISLGDFKIDRWFKQLNVSTAVFDSESAFANVNTPEELLALEKVSA